MGLWVILVRALKGLERSLTQSNAELLLSHHPSGQKAVAQIPKRGYNASVPHENHSASVAVATPSNRTSQYGTVDVSPERDYNWTSTERKKLNV